MQPTASFSEELFHQLAGPPPSLEEKANTMMDALGYVKLTATANSGPSKKKKQSNRNLDRGLKTKRGNQYQSLDDVGNETAYQNKRECQSDDHVENETTADCHDPTIVASKPGVSAHNDAVPKKKRKKEKVSANKKTKPHGRDPNNLCDNIAGDDDDDPFGTSVSMDDLETFGSNRSEAATQNSNLSRQRRWCDNEQPTPVASPAGEGVTAARLHPAVHQHPPVHSHSAQKVVHPHPPQAVVHPYPAQAVVHPTQTEPTNVDNRAVIKLEPEGHAKMKIKAETSTIPDTPASPDSSQTEEEVTSGREEAPSSSSSSAAAVTQKKPSPTTSSKTNKAATTTARGKRPPGPECPVSSLSHKQHGRYLELFRKCTARFLTGNVQPPTAGELQELGEFETLQVAVAKEQEECQAYLQRHANHNPYLYTHLSPTQARYMQEKDEINWRRADSYAHHYHRHSILPLTLTSLNPTFTPPTFTLACTLLQLGSKCRLQLPDMNSNSKCWRTVPTDLDKVAARFPSARAGNKQHDRWNHEPASKDENIQRLVHKHPCHIATSASVLRQLLDNHAPDFTAAWDIPVVVKEYGTESVSRRVVYLDKALLPQGRSASQRKDRYLQRAVQTFLCQPATDKVKVAAASKTRNAAHKGAAPGGKDKGAAGRRGAEDGGGGGDDDDPFGSSVSMDHLETFGSQRAGQASTWDVLTVKSGVGGGTGSEAEGGGGGRNGGEEDTRLKETAGKDVMRPPGVGGGGASSSSPKSTRELSTTSAHEGDTGKKLNSLQTVDRRNKDNTGNPECNSNKSAADVHAAKDSGKKTCATSEADMSSDSEDDGLVIALTESGESSGVEPSPVCRRAGRRSKSCIFDQAPVPPSSVSAPPASGQEMSDVATKRATRSGSQTPCDPNTSAPDSPSPRATRHTSKRHAQSQLQSPERVNKAGDPTHGDPALAKKAKTSPEAALRGTQGSKKPSVAGPTPLDAILKEMAPARDSTSAHFQDDPSDYCPPASAGDHVGYHLWNLSGLPVIVRCNSHAFARDMRQQQRPVYVRARAERQCHYGLEQMTLSESLSSWLGCYLRPNSYLLRARVDVQTDEVVHMEQLELDQILQPTLNFSPACAFTVLQNIFSKLLELPAGSYLLSHDSGADHVALKAGTTTKRGVFDLHCRYMGVGVMREVDRTVPWVPVDPTLVLPHHWKEGRIPATFQPPDFENRQKQQHPFPGQGRGRGQSSGQGRGRGRGQSRGGYGRGGYGRGGQGRGGQGRGQSRGQSNAGQGNTGQGQKKKNKKKKKKKQN